MQHDKRSTHVHSSTKGHPSTATTSEQLKSWCESPQGKWHFYTVWIKTRDVIWRQRGDRGYPPTHDVIKKTGTEFFPDHIIDRAHSFLSKYGMDSNKCLWCGEKWPLYRDHTKCCGKLYHCGCRLYHTWTRPSWQTFCRNCGALNFNEPFMLLRSIMTT